jgi:hypothetical protein
MTVQQMTVLERFLSRAKDLNIDSSAPWFNHGDCEGSDAEAHKIAQSLGYKIRLHPPDNVKLRAYCEGADEIWTPDIYSVRNGNIVRISDLVIATPRSDAEVNRGSGTWQVIRLARKRRNPKKAYVIIYPDGHEDGNDWAKYIH